MIYKLKIKNYKGFCAEQELSFAIPNGNSGSGLTLIVGPNNTGKTTIVESLLINENKKFNESERHKDISPQIIHEFKNPQQDSDNIIRCAYTNVDNGSQIQLSRDAKDDYKLKFELIASRRQWDAESSSEWGPEKLVEFSTAAELRNSNGIDLAGFLKKINKNPERKNNLTQKIKKIIPNFTSWTIDSNDRTDYVKYNTAESSHKTTLLGDGIISIFRICAHLITEDETCILIIDEPELSLHPAAQKSLSKIISDSSKNRQIIICTHSPHFVNWRDFENGAKIVRLNKPNDKECIISSLDEKAKYAKFIKNNISEYQKPQLLDYVAKEILFSEKILFVEGQEDVGLITKWLKDNSIDVNFDIFGYGTGSWANIKPFLHMAKDINIGKAAAIYDNGEETKKEHGSIKKDFKDYHIAILPTVDIRDKPIEPTKVGCFDEHGKLKDEYKDKFEEIMNDIIEYFK